MSWASDMGTRRARVLDSAGQEVPCQFLRPRKFTPRGSSHCIWPPCRRGNLGGRYPGLRARRKPECGDR